MKYKIILTLLLFFTISKGFSQAFKIDTIQYQPSNNKLINLVILADGYTESEIKYFTEDAQRFSKYFFNTEPFRQYAPYFNVFAINTISEESGAAHDCTGHDCPKTHHGRDDLPPRFNEFPKRIYVPESNPKTIFGSSFDNGGIHRLVVPQNQDKIEEILAQHIPNYTQVVILVNSPYYGGSGGKYATATVNYDSNDIAVHEIGHSFSKLADEYWAGNVYAYEGPNRTQQADPKLVSWKHWIGINDVGVYAYGGKESKSNWFRPHEFCKMQYLVAPFCSVCQEILVKTIHDKSNPFIKTAPEETNKLTADSVNKFVVKLAKPSPNTLSVKWYLNDQLLTANVDSIYLNKAVFKIGENIIKAEVTDTTDLVRAPGYQGNTYSKSWYVDALKDYEMEMPLSTWGDTLETCYDGYQALSVGKPQAGVSYAWYATPKSKKPIAKGANWVSPRLKADKVYYLEASYGKKRSPRKAILVKVAQQIQRPQEINVSKSENKINISINDKDIDKYNIEWYTSPEKFHSWGKNTVEIPAEEGSSVIYFKMVDKITTCKSELFKIDI